MTFILGDPGNGQYASIDWNSDQKIGAECDGDDLFWMETEAAAADDERTLA